MIRTDFWPDDSIDLLKKLWTGGLSASAIAAELRANGDRRRTRNSVMSKVRRMGLSYRAGPMKKTKKSKAQPKLGRLTSALSLGFVAKAQPGTPSPPPRPSPALEESIPVTLVDLGRTQCHWPLDEVSEGNPGRWLYCGAATLPKEYGCGEYCHHHWLRLTTKEGREMVARRRAA